MRKSESLVMLGPVLDRLRFEVLIPIIDRVWGIMSRAGILPVPPPEIAGQNVDAEFVSILQTSQQAAMAGSIERMLQMASTMAGIDPAVTDNIDFDMAFDIYAKMLATDPRIIRSPANLMAIRKQRAAQQQQQQALQSAETLSKAGANAANIDVGGGQNLVQRMIQG